jgi:PAS domain S-box-containing protein
MKTVLVLEGNEQDHGALQALLQDHGYTVKQTSGKTLQVSEVPQGADPHNRPGAENAPLATFRSSLDGKLYAVASAAEEAFEVTEPPQGVEQHLRGIYEKGPLGIFRSSLPGKLLSINPAGARMLKYDSPREMIETVNRSRIGEALYLDDSHRQEILAEVLESREWRAYEERFRCKDGSIIDCNFHMRAVSAVDGQPLELEGFFEDISERKRTEEALKMSQFILDEASLGIFRGSDDARILAVNDYWAGKLGYTPGELCSMSFFDIDPSLTPELWRAHREKIAATGSNTFESVHRRKDGTEFPVEITVNLFKYQDQVFSCSFAKDITPRKRAEKALRESERRYRSIVDHAPFGITHSTKDGKLVSVNPALASILKYDSTQELMEAINRSSIQELLFPKPSEREPLVERILSADSWTVFNNRLRCKDGSLVTCRVHSRRIVDEDGQARGFESYQENITDQVEAVQALQESEEKFRVLAETSPVAICIYQGERLVYANPAMEGLFGYDAEELCRMKFWDWVHDDFKELVRSRGLTRLAGENVPGQYEAKYLTKTGQERYVLVSAGVIEYQGRPTGVASFLDITERKRSEELIRSSLAEKEVLLREIHHRVKNNLQVVSSLLYLQSQKLTDPELQSHFLESQSRICSMALAHEQLYQSKSLAEINIRSYVESLVDQLRQIFQRPGQQIECWTVIGDIVLDIAQVIPCGLLITELLSNAYKHAFADGRNGTITISMEQFGKQLALTVADDGVGLPAGLDYRQTTTLGLQLVTALVNQLNGIVALEQEGGTLVRITFAEAVVRDNPSDQQVAEDLF